MSVLTTGGIVEGIVMQNFNLVTIFVLKIAYLEQELKFHTVKLGNKPINNSLNDS